MQFENSWKRFKYSAGYALRTEDDENKNSAIASLEYNNQSKFYSDSAKVLTISEVGKVETVYDFKDAHIVFSYGIHVNSIGLVFIYKTPPNYRQLKLSIRFNL